MRKFLKPPKHDPQIAQYLDLCYRRDVLGDRKVYPERALRGDAEYVASLRKELQRIRGLGISNLAQRDFVSYQNARAIEAALKRLGKSHAS